MYDPAIGRFISEDPIGLADDTNPYRYVKNGPPNGRDPTGLWNESGHFYTAYAVARIAGYEHNKARELAYYAQYLDEVNAYDAAFMGFKHAPGTWRAAAAEVGTNSDNLNDDWEEDVQTVLHQLHGGDESTIRLRRHQISDLFRDAIKDNDLKVAGVLLHSFGDSYAHTYRDGGRWCAFGTRIGHARGTGPLTGERDGGHAVDQIRERYADNAYRFYVNGLADLLDVPDDRRNLIDKLIAEMESTMKNGVVVNKKTGKPYDDDLEIYLLKHFPVGLKLSNGSQDTYAANEFWKPEAKQYFPEQGQMATLGHIPFDDMRMVVRRMREAFVDPE